uniref:Putative gustatory receptor GR9 n=1 Tax=Colaphellus bowringi TaxID=561076 RepID=A0A0S3J2S3_9CUCU|nr:putative gustatory receptor GR9 [Colaphellus bowringi]
MSCDGVERCADRIVTTCYMNLDILEKSPIREEILSFTEYVEQLTPVFSAVGFFQVNQKVLSSLFSAVISYFIIIIQFNSGL